MAEEVEKKFLISAKERAKLTDHSKKTVIGIIQWYIDGGKDAMKSERIRMILTQDGNQRWILGKKECINGDLIRRREDETTLEPSAIQVDTLSRFPFIIKSRTIFKTPFQAEVVLDKLLANPYQSYDTQQLLEIELEDETDDIDKVVQQVLSFFNMEGVKDVSKDVHYTNQAIAFRAKKNNQQMSFPVLLNILKKEIRSDLCEKK